MTDKPIHWRSLHASMNALSEEEIAALLDDEMNIHRRWQIAQRLHQRLCKLRATRERAAILDELAS